MAGQTQAYKNYSGKVAGANILDTPASGNTLNLDGKDGGFVEMDATFDLPITSRTPVGTVVYVYNSTVGALDVEDATGGHTVGAGDVRIFVKITATTWASSADFVLGTP